MKVQRQVLKLFPTVVSVYKNPDTSFHDEIIRVCRNHTMKTERHNFLQTTSDLYKTGLTEKVDNFILDCCDDYLKLMGYYRDPLEIKSSWANISGAGVTTHTQHIHNNSFLSAVYYLSAPEGAGGIYFNHPNQLILCHDPDVENMDPLNQSSMELTPETGMCVVFRATTAHGTTLNQLKAGEERINIAYDISMPNIGHRRYEDGYA
jgi:uncharacterized protein (TIGR02466 family)